MRVNVYLPSFNNKLRDVLLALAEGIPGATTKRLEEFNPAQAGDVGVVFGWYKFAFPPTMVKKPVIDYYLGMGPRHLLVVESAFQRRGDYFQVGWNGFAGNADFRVEGVPIDRAEHMALRAQAWQSNPEGACVVMGQLPRDTQVQDFDHVGWCQQTFAEAQRLYKKAIFRPHPKVEDAAVYGIPEKYQQVGKLHLALKGACCVATFNSTSAVDAVLAGIPTIAMDPGSRAWEVCSHSIAEPLVRPERAAWLAGLGYSQWNLEEMRKGEPWLHLTR